jgi:hypothetical protein
LGADAVRRHLGQGALRRQSEGRDDLTFEIGAGRNSADASSSTVSATTARILAGIYKTKCRIHNRPLSNRYLRSVSACLPRGMARHASVNGGLLRIGEASHGPAVDQRGTVPSFRMAEGGAVAHRGNGSPGRMHRLDQPDGIAVLGQIPQGAVSARIKDGISCDGREPRRVGKERMSRFVLLQTVGRRRLGSGFLAWGSTGGCPPLGREQGDTARGALTHRLPCCNHSLLLTSTSRSDMFATAFGTADPEHATGEAQTSGGRRGNNSQVQH